MSNSDIKYTLRKYEFPQNAKEALSKTEQLLSGRGVPSSKHLDLAMELISEFVFCETDRRGSRRTSTMNPLHELQLIDVICDHLSGTTSEITRNTIFLSLFLGTDKRMKVLCTLASIAMSASNTPMLLAVGTWLQQTGCSSLQSKQLTESLVRDHFILQTTNQEQMKLLATTAPQFVANFITSVTELYFDTSNSMKMPPKNLLDVITAWVWCKPGLCMCAQSEPPALPPGAIPMAAATPLAGLIRWCTLAPLYAANHSNDSETVDSVITTPIKKMKIEPKCNKTFLNRDTHKEADLYKKLHLGVLHSLRTGKKIQGPPTAVNCQELCLLVHTLQVHSNEVLKTGANLTTYAPLQESLDRLGQATQVSLAHGCLYGNISTLLLALSNLPHNRLLSIIISKHHSL